MQYWTLHLDLTRKYPSKHRHQERAISIAWKWLICMEDKKPFPFVYWLTTVSMNNINRGRNQISTLAVLRWGLEEQEDQSRMVIHGCFIIWSGFGRWPLLFVQMRVRALHLQRSNIRRVQPKACLIRVSPTSLEGERADPCWNELWLSLWAFGIHRIILPLQE